MRRLFRSTKTNVIDPLPPPSAPSAFDGQGTSHGAMKSTSYMESMGGANGGQAPVDNQMDASIQAPIPHFETRPRKGSVTPFPIELGHATPSTPPPTHVAAKRSKDSTHSMGKGEKVGTRSAAAGPPTLLEIQQMQAGNVDGDARNRDWLQAQRKPGRHREDSTGSNESTPPEGRSLVSPSMPTKTNGQEAYGMTPPTMAMPSPHPSLSSGTLGTTNGIYPPPPLPPGARPPTPPNPLPIRSNTPTRSYHSTSMAPAQNRDALSSSMNGITLGDVPPPTRSGRDRGYSSASGRGSDHESTSGHGHGGLTSLSSIPAARPNKQTPPSLPVRSPLVNSYATPDNTTVPAAFPTAHPFVNTSPATSQPPHHPHPHGMARPLSNANIRSLKAELPNLPPRPQVDMDQSRDISVLGGKEKEKKKFWGMAWGDKKEKEKGKEKERGRELERPSIDERRSFEEVPSSHSHGDEDSGYRGRVMGLDFGRKDQQHSASNVDNVTTAIQLLCSHPDPPFSSTYEVCDRINHSSSPDSVAKEAVQAIRKHFKHGNEAERRTAAKIWFIMMRNIAIKGFRANATSKKFMAALEPILLAPATKPLVSVATHRLLVDILADLTYNYGGEKGCEGLGELWRKVKMPQEPELGKPLHPEHPLYAPDDFFHLPTAHTPQADFRRASSLAYMPVPPLPPRGVVPAHSGGPGYTDMPNHGEDIRRLIEECTAAKESARVLAEALVFTRPDELESKPIIKEFYMKSFYAHESLTNQMEWAQAEAARSRERVILSEQSTDGSDEHYETTFEERALASLFEAHGHLSEALQQHDELERMARDESEMREVRDRSRKEVRMDRNAAPGLLLPENHQSGPSSREPSPSPGVRLPMVSSPQGPDRSLPLPMPPRPQHSADHYDARSRTPSPDSHPLPHPPRLSASPARTSSPLGIPNGAAKRLPRPLPNPFARGANDSQPSLGGFDTGLSNHHNPSRSGTGDSYANSQPKDDNGEEEDGRNLPAVPLKPSRKALGKRRAVLDVDNHFNPDDMFSAQDAPIRARAPSTASAESLTADDVYLSQPVTYAYDAYQEKLELESRQGSASGGTKGSHGTRDRIRDMARESERVGMGSRDMVEA